MKERVLRIPSADPTNTSFVVVKVSHVGPSSLDIRVTGTDGVYPYLALVRGSEVNKLRANSYSGGDEEWRNIVSASIGLAAEASIHATKDIEIVVKAHVDAGTRIEIVLRQNVAGIMQRLGSLSLLRADDEEIELFAWAAFAAQADADSTKERVLLKARLNDQEAALSQLQQQMQEFVEAKTESEDVLVRKFAAILNAKKAKIRDLLGEQSRSKSAASQLLVEDEPKQTEPSKTKPSKSQPARRGRPSKRKIASKQSKSDSDDIFQPTTKAQELKDIKVEAKEDPLPSEDQLEASTPEKSDLDATEDEDDNLQARQLANSGIGLEGRPTETDTNRKALDVNAQQQEEPPPRRVLPFARKPSQVASLEAGDESTDDEL